MRGRLLAAALAALLAAQAAHAAPVPARPSEYGLIILNERVLGQGGPFVGWDAILPCIEARDRPYCLLRAAAEHGGAQALRWDLRFLSHRRALERAGVMGLVRDQAPGPEDLVPRAVWLTLEAQARGAKPPEALTPVRELRADAGVRSRESDKPKPTSRELRIAAYARLEALAAADPAEGLETELRTGPALRGAALQAWTTECLAIPRQDESMFVDGPSECAPAFLGLTLRANGRGDDARVIERRWSFGPSGAFWGVYDQALLDLAQGRLDAAAQGVLTLEPWAKADFRLDSFGLCLAVVRAANATDRHDLALAVARHAIGSGSNPELTAVIERWGEPADRLALAQRLEAARAQAASHGSDGSQVIFEGRPAHSSMGPPFPNTPGEDLGYELARNGPDDPRMRAALAQVTPQRRATAFYYCAEASAEKDRQRLTQCLERFDPRDAPPERTAGLATLAFETAMRDRPGEPQARAALLRVSARLARAAGLGNPPPPTTGALLGDDTMFSVEVLRDYAIAELRERGEW